MASMGAATAEKPAHLEEQAAVKRKRATPTAALNVICQVESLSGFTLNNVPAPGDRRHGPGKAAGGNEQEYRVAPGSVHW